MYLEAVNIAVKHCDYIKMRYADHNNLPLIEKALDTGKTLLISVPHKLVDAFAQHPYHPRMKALYCFPPESIVYTADYPERIDETQIGDYVLSHTGHWQKVQHIFKRQFNGELLRIKCEGLPPFLSTPNHVFFAGRLPKGTGHDKEHYVKMYTEWIDAAHLKDGNLCNKTRPDYLFSVIPKLPETKIDRLTIPKLSIKDGNSTNANSRIPESTPLNHDLLTIFAAFISEGSIAKGQIVFTFKKGEKLSIEVLNSMASLFERVIPCIYEDAMIQRQAYCSSVLHKWFESLFYSNSIHNALYKKIPSLLFSLSVNDKMFLFNKLIMGDGHRYDKRYGRKYNNYSEYGTASEILAWQLYYLLLSTGEVPSLQIRKARWYTIQNRKVWGNKFYSIRINHSLKRPNYRIVSNIIGRPIRYIEKIPYTGFVHNLAIDNDNSFSINGIVAHNCLPRYPPEIEDFNLDLASSCDGFSSHFPHTVCDLACVINRLQNEYFIEKHVMLPKREPTKIEGYSTPESLPPIDAAVSINFQELKNLICQIHMIEKIKRTRI